MDEYRNFKFDDSKLLTNEFTGIYGLQLPKNILQSLLENSFQLSYTHILTGKHKNIATELLHQNYSKSILAELRTQVSSMIDDIISRIELDESTKPSSFWFREITPRLRVENAIFYIDFKAKFYFNSPTDMTNVVENIILPIRLEY